MSKPASGGRGRGDSLGQCRTCSHVLGCRPNDCRPTKAGRVGTAVDARLARELRNNLPEVKGFSDRNIKRMLAFYRAYPGPETRRRAADRRTPSAAGESAASCGTNQCIPKSAAACGTIVDSLLSSIPWFHRIILIEKVKDLSCPRLVYGADARQWLEPQHPFSHDRVRGPSSSGQSSVEFRWAATTARNQTWFSKRSKTHTYLIF